ncbi:MAG: valine--tRNA ligase [Chloroflexota bacterium]|nr:valine--tRNA ligase [Chloroflexota bacterium]MDQ5866061.1 valine--tRNA ligase [Chloroflexota bacterium]
MTDIQDKPTNEEQQAGMAKAYSHEAVEGRWYDWWEQQGYFTAQRDPNRKPFTIIMPPPNVTGELHMGHALTNAVEDILIRWRRMQGYEALYLPGEDHAGISGQYVVEKELAKEELSRHDIGREKFLERAWEWMNEYRPRIRYQLRRLGASCDWTRERFTLDPDPVNAVRTVFKRLYDKGLIYKGERIVNWCPRCMTTLSDLEVEPEEEQGHLWTIRYPLAGDPTQGIEVATTRPETMLGDTAVAVHPDDERWQHLIGKEVILPIMERPIPVVADSGVDKEFGTGAVKITPGHDPLDFEIGQRHSLPVINIINLDGTLNDNAGLYAGLGVEEARAGVLRQLEDEGYLLRTDPHTHSVPHCERCGTVLEPIVSDQWFVKMQPLAAPAIEVVRRGEIRIVPERFTKVYYHWMENIRDWPISRQLWWGHRVPVFYCDNGHEFASTEEKPASCETCGSTNLRQDEDVLDTWFSSGLWPFSTLGWPEETEDFKYFYPTDVMETGYDILFFWVARMIFQGLEHTGRIPFHTVYLHGLVRDESGRKMSKSKWNNAVDPIELANRFGSDAVRMSLITNSSPGNDQKFSDQRTEQAGHFANKLWNATRFVISNLGIGISDLDGIEENPQSEIPIPKSLPDRWILSRYSRTVSQVTQMLEDYQLGEAGKVLQEFVWSEYCDWYIEAAKGALRSEDAETRQTTLAVARTVLDGILRLLHPYMPFVTEELWQNLHGWPSRDGSLDRREQSIIVAEWPAPLSADDEAERDFDTVIEIIRQIRNARAETIKDAPDNLKGEMARRRIEAIVGGGSRTAMLQQESDTLARLAQLDAGKLTITERVSDEQRPEQAATLVIGEIEVVLPMSGLVDTGAERKRLQSEAESTRAEIERTEALLSNEQFTSRAPAQVVERERAKLAAAHERLSKLNERLATL